MKEIEEAIQLGLKIGNKCNHNNMEHTCKSCRKKGLIKTAELCIDIGCMAGWEDHKNSMNWRK